MASEKLLVDRNNLVFVNFLVFSFKQLHIVTIDGTKLTQLTSSRLLIIFSWEDLLESTKWLSLLVSFLNQILHNPSYLPAISRCQFHSNA